MHLLTDPLEAPKATAMLCCDQPCCLSSQARKRRHSFQACGDGVVGSMPLFYAEKSFLHCAAVCKGLQKYSLRSTVPFDSASCARKRANTGRERSTHPQGQGEAAPTDVHPSALDRSRATIRSQGYAHG